MTQPVTRLPKAMFALYYCFVCGRESPGLYHHYKKTQMSYCMWCKTTVEIPTDTLDPFAPNCRPVVGGADSRVTPIPLVRPGV